jgi:putative phage-type endonuclease
MDRNEWLKRRNDGLGASDAAVVLEMSRYKSKLRLWAEKTGLIEAEDISEKEVVYWGVMLEETVAKEFAKRSGLKVQRRNAILQHPDHPFMLANVDRLIVGREEGLECKTAHALKAKEWNGDEVPDEYYLQCQHCMAVTGYKTWYIAVLIGGQKFIFKEIPRNEKVIANMIVAEAEFWALVESNIPPEPDGSEDCAELALELFPEGQKDLVTDLPEEALGMIDRYRSSVVLKNQATKMVTAAQTAIELLMGDCVTGLIGEWKVTWSNTAGRSGMDAKKLKAEMPNVYEKYAVKGKPGRRFSLSDNKEGGARQDEA